MTKNLTLNVRVSGALGEHVAANVGEDGAYENVSEYVRDLIRRDKEPPKPKPLPGSRPNCRVRIAAPDSAYRPLDAAAVIKRNARKRA